ncbi:hypothetical protein CHELA17_65308 [Chelatococcus asaccharovorans]|nr:hypothetical protein CHELA17_65308 [Chelatococcus asaccharovorans]
MRKLPLEHEGADHEVVVRMHIVTATCAVEDLVAEYADWTEPWTAALVVVKVEAGCTGNEAIRMSCNIGRTGAVRPDRVMAAFMVADDE